MILAASSGLFAASCLLLLAPSPVIAVGTPSHVDCYSSLPSNFKDMGNYTYQSSGWCQKQCVPMNYPVMAMTKGSDCWCGNELPSNSSKTDTCTESCDGYSSDACGGPDSWDVYLTGLTSEVSIADGSGSTSTSTSSATTSTTGGVTVITQAGQTIVVTASSDPSATAKSSGGTSTAGIAAGVVVGVIALAAIIGAAVFFLRRRQKQRVEEEYRRNAEISAFTQKPSSMSSDARWDSDFMAQRRQSNGSIADAGDFSRRILQVTNPDR